MATIHSTTALQQPSQVYIPGQPTGTRASSANPQLRHKETIYRLGVTEIVIGAVCIILTIVPLSITETELEKYWERNYAIYGYDRYRINTSFSKVASGIWAGIFNIITGVLAVRIKVNDSRCNHILNMILAIITANVTFSAAVLSGIAAGLSSFSDALIAIQAIISILNIASMIINIIHASFCCSGACCDGGNGITQPVMYVPAQYNVAYPQQQYVQGPNGQLMLVPNQPYAIQGNPQTQITLAANAGYPGYYPIQQPLQTTAPI